MDDIPFEDSASESEREPGEPAATEQPSAPRYRRVGPESEVRGGPEAPAPSATDVPGTKC